MHFRCDAERLPFKASVDVVGHKKHHAQLLECDELHIPLITLPHRKPFEQSFRVDISHGSQSMATLLNESFSKEKSPKAALLNTFKLHSFKAFRRRSL